MRIGELLKELPKSNRWKSNSQVGEVDSKADALRDANISKSEANRLERLADHPDVVEQVIQDTE